MPERLRTLRHCIVTGGVTPSVIACGDATFPKGTASVAAAKFPSQPKGVPLGELANGVSLRGFASINKKLPRRVAGGAFIFLF